MRSAFNDDDVRKLLEAAKLVNHHFDFGSSMTCERNPQACSALQTLRDVVASFTPPECKFCDKPIHFNRSLNEWYHDETANTLCHQDHAAPKD